MVKLDKKKIIESYSGDNIWLEEIEKQILENINNNKDLTTPELERLGRARELITSLWKLNYVIIEIETKNYFEKYTELYNVYGEMKIDLMDLIGYGNFWEEL